MQRLSSTGTVGGGGGGISIPNLIVVDSDVADIGAAVNAADALLGASPGGILDIAAAVSAVTIIKYIKQLVTMAKALGAKRVLVGTIPSSTTYSAPQNVQIALVNTWIRSKVGWIDDVFDVDALVGTAGAHPTYFATGGIHLTTAAFDVLEPAFPVLS